MRPAEPLKSTLRRAQCQSVPADVDAGLRQKNAKTRIDVDANG